MPLFPQLVSSAFPTTQVPAAQQPWLHSWPPAQLVPHVFPAPQAWCSAQSVWVLQPQVPPDPPAMHTLFVAPPVQSSQLPPLVPQSVLF